VSYRDKQFKLNAHIPESLLNAKAATCPVTIKTHLADHQTKQQTELINKITPVVLDFFLS
jgi:hypothetical protein